jgi:hypothetical protein
MTKLMDLRITSENVEELIYLDEHVSTALIDFLDDTGEFEGDLVITIEHIPCRFCHNAKIVNICPECERDYSK